MNRDEYYAALNNNSELYHHGIKGQRWGIRRFQNEDGSLTPEGEARRAKYEKKIGKAERKIERLQPKLDRQLQTNVVKATKLQNQAAKLRAKEHNLFTTKKKAENLEFKAKKKEARAEKLLVKANKYQSQINKLNARIRKYDRKISKIDPTHVANGKAAVDALLSRYK